jgi:hypothetical protein
MIIIQDLEVRNSRCGVFRVADNKTSLEIVEDTALKNLRAMIKRGKSTRTFLQLKAYPIYIKAQMKRWMTENTSQGTAWAPLNSKYASYKLKKFGSNVGAGKKIMIATGRLYQSIIGAGDGHFKLITDSSMIVGTTLDYAKFAASKRPIMKFNKDMIAQLKADWIKFMIQGKGT